MKNGNGGGKGRPGVFGMMSAQQRHPVETQGWG
jgi:hypothetical protein